MGCFCKVGIEYVICFNFHDFFSDEEEEDLAIEISPRNDLVEFEENVSVSKENFPENENYYDPGNGNDEHKQHVKELEEKGNCNEGLGESEVEKVSTKAEVDDKAFRILSNETEQTTSKPKMGVKRTKSMLKTKIEKIINKLEGRVEKISFGSEADLKRF